jgi:hypothetical protein
MANEIVTEIRLELDKLRADLKLAEKAGEETGKRAGKEVGEGIEAGLGRAFGSLKTQLLALGGAIAGAFTLKESIAAAAEAQANVQALNSAMALAGTYSDAASAGFQKFAASMQETTKASEDAVLQGGALLTSLGKLSGTELERASRAAVDFAAALSGQGMTVENAFAIVSKAAAGNIGALSRYGIQVKDTGDNAADFANALAQLESRFKGMAAMQANTFDGAMERTKNQFGEVLESLGNIIVKSPTVITGLNMLANAFKRMAAGIEEFANGRDLINEMSMALANFGKALAQFVVAPLELAYNVGKVVFNGLLTLVQGAMFTVASAVGGVTALLAKVSPERFGEINAAVQNFAQSSKDVLDQFANQTAESTGEIFNFDVAAKAEEYSMKLGEWVAAVTPVAQANFAQLSESIRQAQQPPLLAAWSFMENGFAAAFSRTTLLGEKFRTDLQGRLNSAFTAFRDGVAGSFASIGQALVKGENAFAAFGKALLGVFGDLAIQIGTFYFLLGLANLFLNPAAAAAEIAGGLALIVLGGALKALAGGGGGGASAGASAGGGGEGGGVAASRDGRAPTNDNGQSFQENERGAIGTSVQVNVQGNVLDRKETGMYLADVINETFGSNGVTFATGNA